MAVVEMNELISRKHTTKLATRVAACGVAVALAAGCGGGGGKKQTAPPVVVPTPTAAAGDTTGTPALPGGVTPVYPAGTKLPDYTGTDLVPYIDAMKNAGSHGLTVWGESDLVKQWKSGPDAFNSAVQKLAAEAKAVPGLVGFKIADELGQKGQNTTTSPAEALSFLHDARAALHANAPGKLIAIDVIGFDLGCVPGSTESWHQKCIDNNEANDASMPLEAIDQIVKSGYIDVLNVTTNMQDPATYVDKFKTTRTEAQKAAFGEVVKRGWDKQIVVNTRKAFSWNTDKIPDATTAAALVPDFIDVPIAAGAKAVDTWSFSQIYSKTGKPVYQISEGYQTNALWNAFKAEKARGVNLFTHYTPSHSMGTLDQDMAAISTAFTGVYCAAGTR